MAPDTQDATAHHIWKVDGPRVLGPGDFHGAFTGLFSKNVLRDFVIVGSNFYFTCFSKSGPGAVFFKPQHGD